MSVNRKEVILIDIGKLSRDPEQPRTEFSAEDIAATAFTVESQGIINPIEIDENYMIVTGEIRWRAAQQAGLKQVPCVVWRNGKHKRFERQVVENMHHHQLTDKDREAAIVKLWKTGEYPTQEQLGKAVGLGKSRIAQILGATEFRERTGIPVTGISTSAIEETSGIDDKLRVKILEKVSEGKIDVKDIREVKKIAQSSGALLDKVLENKIPLQRATEAAETMQQIAAQGVSLTEAQMQNLADKVAEDETLLDKYKSAVLEKVRQVATAPRQPRITEPIGRESPVQYMIKVKDEVMDRYKIYLGNCDIDERRWAKKIMIETRDELSVLIEMIQDD